jgi:hypothetical protein
MTDAEAIELFEILLKDHLDNPGLPSRPRVAKAVRDHLAARPWRVQVLEYGEPGVATPGYGQRRPHPHEPGFVTAYVWNVTGRCRRLTCVTGERWGIFSGLR